MKNNILIIVVVVALVVGAGGFFAGMKYQQSKRPSFGQFARDGQRGQFQNRNGQNFRPVSGEIISSDEKSITVKLQDVSSKIVVLSEVTSINKAEQGSKEDLKTGEQVAVFGTENSDGSVTAQNVQLNPQFRGIPSGSSNNQ